MAGKKLKTSRELVLDQRKHRYSFNAAWESEVAGGKRIAELAFGQDSPQNNVEDAIKQARYWFQYSWMVGTIVLLRMAFYNYGLKLKAFDKADQNRLDEWQKKPANRYEIQRYARDAWQEFLVTDNVVTLWRLKGKPVVYQAEDCKFRDEFGIERLMIRTGLSTSELREIQGLSPAEVARIGKGGGNLELTHADPLFGFDVLKREKVGSGFAWPGIARIFLPASQTQGMEVGDNLLGQTDRKVYEQHQQGHETRYGTMAGTKINFANHERAHKLEHQLKGKVGHIILVTNFDHKIMMAAGRVDPKFYDGKKYDASIKRFSVWAAPLAQMFLERNLNPNLMDLLRAQAQLDREYMEPHLATVYKEGMKVPVPCKPAWSNRCFKDARLAADLMKFAVQWGFMSQQTAQEETGLDSDQEYERKEQESKMPPAATQPLVDANHGKDGGKNRAGRKRGTPDKGADK